MADPREMRFGAAPPDPWPRPSVEAPQGAGRKEILMAAPREIRFGAAPPDPWSRPPMEAPQSGGWSGSSGTGGCSSSAAELGVGCVRSSGMVARGQVAARRPPSGTGRQVSQLDEGSSGSSAAIWVGSAPPTVIEATVDSESAVGVPGEGDVHGVGGGAAVDVLDTASSSSGPRGRGQKRYWKEVVGRDCRAYLPGRVSPLEDALRQYGDRDGGPIIKPAAGMEFDSCEEAHEYYNLYSWERGFGIKHASSHCYTRDDGQKYRNMVLLTCACGGKPDAGAKKSIKQECPALMKLLRTDDDGWYIQSFRDQHNHALSETCGEKRCWKSHREIDPHTKQMIKQLRSNNISLTKVYCLMKDHFSRNPTVPVSKRSLRNLCYSISKENSEDDIRKTVEVFSRLHEEDEGFGNVVELDSDGRIKNMMWTNSQSRHAYSCFGDAITFDTTYKTNKYNMPFGLFVGVNNHFQSVIFAGVLMREETIKGFEWVFTEFVSLMGGRAM